MRKILLYFVCFQFFFGLIVGQNQSFKTNSIVTRRVLLENYGGMKCGNCPPANDSATYLKNLYGNEVAVINIHSGFFASPNTTYPTDFRTQAGYAWDNFFGISMVGNPNGMVNRKDYPSNHVKSHNTWHSEIAGFIGQSAIAEISVSHTYNPGNRLLNVDIKTKFSGTSSANYKLVAALTEDGIVATQLDYTLPSGSQINTSYVHNHVLRESLLGSWGSLLNTLPVATNDSIISTVTNFSISPNYNDNNLNIVAFIYDTLTFEVMQVERIGIQSTVTGIKNNTQKFNYSFFPNPTNSTLSITSSVDYNSIKIINSIGQTVFVFEDKPNTISVSNLSNGIYFIQLLDKKGILLKTEKFIKQ